MLPATTGQGGQPARWRRVPGAVRVPEAQRLPGDAEGQGRHGAPQRRRGRDRVGHGEPLLRAAIQVNGTERSIIAAWAALLRAHGTEMDVL